MSEFYVNWTKEKFQGCIQSFMLPWKLRKRQILLVNQNLSLVYFSPAKFQLVSWNLSLAEIWRMTYTHKLPKQCSATLKGSIICTNACSETLFPPRFLSCDLWWALPGKGIRSMGNGLNLEAHVISRWKEILQVIVLLNRTICAVVIFRFKETWWLPHWSWKRQSLSTTLLIST